MPDETSPSALIMQALIAMQQAQSDHGTYVVGQVTAARQALEGAMTQLAAQVAGLETAMASLVPLLNRIVEHVEKQPKPEPKPKVASYVELYPALRPSPVAGETPVSAGHDARVEGRSSPWRRFFGEKGDA